MIKLHFFERHEIPGLISLEKVFAIIIPGIEDDYFKVKKINNPFLPLSKIIQAGFYLRKHQGDLNHITGDIHWATLFLDSKKTVLTIHDVVGVNSYKGLKKWLYLLLWVYLPLWKAKYITAISEKTKNELLKYYPSASKKIHVIPNPLTSEIKYRKPVSKNIEDIKLLIVGTRENKNVPRILEACENIPVNITIVGKADDSRIAKNSKFHLTTETDVSDERLEELYLESDILCFPSLYEGFGMPIIEAQAKGCAVITSNIEPMISVAGDAALFVNPENTDEIKKSIENLSQNFELRSKLVEKGYSNVEKYKPEMIVHQYKELYHQILNEAH